MTDSAEDTVVGTSAGSAEDPAAPPTSYWCAHALLPEGAAEGVRLIEQDGRWVRVERAARPVDGDVLLPGMVLPGLADCHSHAFHRALRGRTHADGGTFWTWRERMYAVAGRLDPESYFLLARAVFAEMAAAGVTGVGEFHYVHHRPGGSPYPDPNAMGEALRRAAREAGVRLTLLDTCYLHGGLGADGHLPLSAEQRRFSDGSVQAWAQRHARLREDATTRIGAAIHSVRAVAAEDLPVVVEASRGQVLHAHVSEQPAENESSRAFHGATPVEVLARGGALGERFTAVHATHLEQEDIALLGRTGSTACFCPTTERDLADGIGPVMPLLAAGARISLGSDQHAVIDLIEEARALEMDERLRSGERGRLAPEQLLAAATDHRSIGWEDAGRLAEGARADAVAVRLDSRRTAGILPAQVLLAATAEDVTDVIADGRPVVRHGRHHLGDVGALLREAIEPLRTENP